MGGLFFGKEDRIRLSREFREIAKNGARAQTRDFVLLVKKSGLDRSRLGVTVSKKVGNAAVRNRTKRIIREFFRLHRDEFPGPVDMVVIAKPLPEGRRPDLHEAERQLQPAVARIWQRISDQ